jgi:hypothetical protein
MGTESQNPEYPAPHGDDSMRALASSYANNEHEAAAEISFSVEMAVASESGSPPTCTAQATAAMPYMCS